MTEKERRELLIIKYLNASGNSTTRELIFRYGFMFDLKLASANMNRSLKIYEQEVDNEGCDLIIEDGTDFSRKIQLKSTFHTRTNSWNIHKSILLPAFSQMEDYGFDTVLCPNFPGGVILIEGCLNEFKNCPFPVQLRYSYTDINILGLISLGAIKRNKNAELEARRVVGILKNQFGERTIKVKKSLFIQLKNAESLIKVMGFNQELDFVNNSRKLIQTNVAPGKFYRDTIRDYIPYQSDPKILDEWNGVRENRNQACRRNLTKMLDDVIAK